MTAAAGHPIVWLGNCVHWGSGCDPEDADPRVSVAFTLRRADVPAPAGSVPLSRADAAGAGLATGLRMMCRSVLLHRHWFDVEEGPLALLADAVDRASAAAASAAAASASPGHDVSPT